MKHRDEVGLTFANTVLAQGFFNGVVNVTLGAYTFDPEEDGRTIDVTPVIVARLRMDVQGARALYNALGTVLAAMDNPAAPPSAIDGTEARPESKPN